MPITKEDLQNFKGEIVHQFHIVAEGLVDQIKLLAEGHAGVIERLDRVEKGNDLLAEGHLAIVQRLDRIEKENERHHLETRALIKLSFSQLDSRLTDLESQVKELQAWRKKVEARFQI
jgi:hypothetical protein